jgi:hypothetical protein
MDKLRPAWVAIRGVGWVLSSRGWRVTTERRIRGRKAGLSRRCLILLVRPTRVDLECIISQRSLQRLRLVSWRAHPNVALLVGRQDHRHGLGMDRLDHRVRCCRQEAIDVMRAGNGLGLSATVTLELGPDASKRRERSVIMECEPHHVLLFGFGGRLGRIFSEAVGRDQTAVFRLEPSLPVFGAAIRTGEQSIFPVERNRPFILPMSGRKWKFITDGIRILDARSAFAVWSNGRPAYS